MITGITVGNITHPENQRHLIIGMNSQLTDVRGIGRPFVNQKPTHPIGLGSVLSFKYDNDRNLHMLICHHIGMDGWAGANMHVRYGMDYLWHTEGPGEKFSIVQIGTGRVGKRDGADHVAIHEAMATSYLPVELFVLDKKERVAAADVVDLPLKAYRVWHPIFGEERLAA